MLHAAQRPSVARRHCSPRGCSTDAAEGSGRGAPIAQVSGRVSSLGAPRWWEARWWELGRDGGATAAPRGCADSATRNRSAGGRTPPGASAEPAAQEQRREAENTRGPKGTPTGRTRGRAAAPHARHPGCAKRPARSHCTAAGAGGQPEAGAEPQRGRPWAARPWQSGGPGWWEPRDEARSTVFLTWRGEAQLQATRWRLAGGFFRPARSLTFVSLPFMSRVPRSLNFRQPCYQFFGKEHSTRPALAHDRRPIGFLGAEKLLSKQRSKRCHEPRCF